MIIGLAIGGQARGRARYVYDSIDEAGFRTAFILYCFPDPEVISRVNSFRPLAGILKLGYRLVPMWILRILLRSRLPDFGSNIYYAKGINSSSARRLLLNENPSAVIVLDCGIVRQRLCELFHNRLLNAHAGKLPGFRGTNNVEWAYLEYASLIGTVHFMASGIDSGDIVYEAELTKEIEASSIDSIRRCAFDQTFALLPKALRKMQESDFEPRKQPSARTTRYSMHPFLRHILQKQLNITG